MDFTEKIFINNLENNMKTKTPWYMSSQNPEALSLSIRGALLMYVPFLLALATNFHIPLTNNGLVEIITDISFIIAGLMLVAGLLRKAYNWYTN